MRRHLSLSLLAALAGSALASAAEAQTSDFLRPTAGARFESGTTVEVVWAPPSTPASFDETELILSLDGGRTFPVRITADVSKAAGRFSWRVPALFTQHARLALRAGLDEQADSEAILLLGSEFAIVPAPRNSLEELFWIKGEWRTREALESFADFPLETSLGEESGEQIDATPEGARVAEPPGSFALAMSDELVTGDPSPKAEAQESSPFTRTTRPLSIPLRQ